MNGPAAPEFAEDPDSLPDEDYNADGTYDYPPAPRSAAQVLAFWSRIRIPDISLGNYERVYRVDVEQDVAEKMARWESAHQPQPRTDASSDNGEWKAQREAAEAGFRAERPAAVPRHLLRIALRCTGMHRDSSQLPEDQKRAVLRSPITLPGEGRMRVADVVDRHGPRHLSQVDLALAPSSGLERHSLDDIVAQIRQTRERLEDELIAVAGQIRVLQDIQPAAPQDPDYRSRRFRR
ncbi:hypothetical protein ACTXL6_00095 [Brachybacterium tyrofermentans]|uniref:hypothetical protein n=1 Tax=Brachybacterium tyrofermentans TaxID=47848 RepID=UPI003FD0D719